MSVIYVFIIMIVTVLIYISGVGTMTVYDLFRLAQSVTIPDNHWKLVFEINHAAPDHRSYYAMGHEFISSE